MVGASVARWHREAPTNTAIETSPECMACRYYHIWQYTIGGTIPTHPPVILQTKNHLWSGQCPVSETTFARSKEKCIQLAVSKGIHATDAGAAWTALVLPDLCLSELVEASTNKGIQSQDCSAAIMALHLASLKNVGLWKNFEVLKMREMLSLRSGLLPCETLDIIQTWAIIMAEGAHTISLRLKTYREDWVTHGPELTKITEAGAWQRFLTGWNSQTD